MTDDYMRQKGREYADDGDLNALIGLQQRAEELGLDETYERISYIRNTIEQDYLDAWQGIVDELSDFTTYREYRFNQDSGLVQWFNPDTGRFASAPWNDEALIEEARNRRLIS